MDAVGTASPTLFKGLIVQLAQIGTSKSLEESELNFATSIVKGIAPRDATEALLATQMAATHNATMTAAWRLSKSENLHQQEAYTTMLTKCTRTYATQVETLKRYRSTGEQVVRVQHQHVNVHGGAQAVVANNLQAGTGGYEKIGHQPHAQGSPEPALLSHDQTEHASDARRLRSRAGRNAGFTEQEAARQQAVVTAGSDTAVVPRRLRLSVAPSRS
jgi:hypothetical protein